MYTTFDEALDSLFGGYLEGHILHVYGEAKVGKTTLACYLPIVSALKANLTRIKSGERLKCVVLCADRGFDVNRLKQIAQCHEVDVDAVNKALRYYDVGSFEQQHELITKRLQQTFDDKDERPLVIAVDPMTSHYRAIFFQTPPEKRLSVALKYIGLMEVQLQSLLSMARRYNCVVAVTNWLKSSLRDEAEANWTREFGGGKAFQYYPHCSLKLQAVPGYRRLVRITVSAHRFRPAGESMEFELWDGGLRRHER